MTITAYGLLAALSLVLLLITALWWMRRHDIGYTAWLQLCLWGIPLALVCSRVMFSLFAIANGDFPSPVQALYPWHGGASIIGAFIGLVLAAVITGKRCGASIPLLLDGIALGAPIALITERLSEFHVDMGIGRPVDAEFLQFLGAFTDGRHPVFLYEAAIALAILIVLLTLTLRGRVPKHPGDLMLIFLVLYGSTQVLMESLRDDAHMVIYFIRINQIAALIMCVAAFVVWLIRWGRKGAKPWHMALAAILVIAGIALGIVQEFAVDSNPNLLLEYGIMVLALVLIAAVTLIVRRKAE